MTKQNKPSKIVAIVQSSYIPWKGYFDLINKVDHFILFDDIQFTKRNWRNRNRIRTPNGSQWLTLPVKNKGRYFQRIDETEISDPHWNRKHWNTLQHNYAKAPFFKSVSSFLKPFYFDCHDTMLSDINHHFISAINDYLGIDTPIGWSQDYPGGDDKNSRLISICSQIKATQYISGPSAKFYVDEKKFLKEGIEVKWMDYSGYSEYPQLYPPFDHHVTVLDMLFNLGKETVKYMKSFNDSHIFEK
ncbi:WbqC family protein [Magnetococcales bacterium HHB-1]